MFLSHKKNRFEKSVNLTIFAKNLEKIAKLFKSKKLKKKNIGSLDSSSFFA
jgi:hypothetical protein